MKIYNQQCSAIYNYSVFFVIWLYYILNIEYILLAM